MAGDEIVKVPVPDKRPKPPPRDPTDWRPKDNSDYEEHQITVEPRRWSADPLNYGSLAEALAAQDANAALEGIEARALADLRQAMNQYRYHPDEKSLRVKWTLTVEGLGWKAPDGFIHPEAPPDIQRESQAAWKRVVEIATDSLSRTIFVRVWRRKQRALPGVETSGNWDEAPKRKEVES